MVLVTVCVQTGAPFKPGFARLDSSLGSQVQRVVALILQQKLTPLQRSVLENIIIAKVC